MSEPIELHIAITELSGDDKPEAQFCLQDEVQAKEDAYKVIRVRKPYMQLYLYGGQPFPTYNFDAELDKWLQDYIAQNEELSERVNQQTQGLSWSIWRQ